VPTKHQEKFKTVRALKEGYEPYEQGQVPLQTDQEMTIMMQKKKNL
jgi:hypothetical protein